MDNQFIASLNKLGSAIEQSSDKYGPLTRAILAAQVKKNPVNKILIGASTVSNNTSPVGLMAKEIMSMVLQIRK
jgi:hypothetical protein